MYPNLYTVVAFLASVVGPRVAAAYAHTTLIELTKDDQVATSDYNVTDSSQQKDSTPLSDAKVRAASKAGLSTAATKAKLFADHEEREIQRLSANIINHQVRNDVIRYRYGDEQHLEKALKRIFQYGLGAGIPRRSAPTLKLIREEVTGDGRYCLVLVFEAKDLQLSDFAKRQAKFASFFGPDISAEVVEGEGNLYEVRLISDMTP